ncbi:MAG TPA: DUF4412 domain-containing protein [Anaeromyxobacteraceae bacterium]|nr:DUF4412 domain-containing protein [Anaeromyxobacteraceae bacterium]
MSFALAAALTSGAAPPPFEGVLESTLSVDERGVAGKGTAKIYMSAAGMRMEVNFVLGGASVSMTSLVLRARPGVVFLLDNASRSYSELDSQGAPAGESGKFTVKELGHEKVAGYDTVHVVVTDPRGEMFEVWTTQEIGGAEAYWASQPTRGKWAGFYKALEAAGAGGWPMKWSQRESAGGSRASFEVTKVEAHPLPGELFDLSGYQRSKASASSP